MTPHARAGAANTDPRWIKSSLSFANADCVEVASLPDGQIGVRDSKDTGGPVLRFTSSEWNAFVGGVLGGEFDHRSRADRPNAVAAQLGPSEDARHDPC